MAETGAYISATYLKKPSVFELIAQESLSKTFHPALKRVAYHLAAQNPVRYGWMVPWYEECFLIFNLLLQHHYLKNFGATFSENFYNLQRVVSKKGKSPNFRIPLKREILSLVFVTVYPYIRNKLEILAEKYENEDDSYYDRTVSRQQKDVIIAVHKISHFIMEAISMFLYVGYMTGRIRRHSIFLWLAGVKLTYRPEEAENTTMCWKSLWTDIWTGNLRSALAMAPFTKVFSGALELSAFFIQFLNWWHSEQLFFKLNAYPVPPAPNIKNTKYQINDCPICKNRIHIAAALSVSGYVFCFKCIHKELRKSKKCPVTGIPASENELIRVYEDYS